MILTILIPITSCCLGSQPGEVNCTLIDVVMKLMKLMKGVIEDSKVLALGLCDDSVILNEHPSVESLQSANVSPHLLILVRG